MNRILLTGAAGRLGKELRGLLRNVYPVLRVSDVLPLGDAQAGEEVDKTDLTDMAAVLKMMEGVDGVIHLGGVAAECDWDSILDVNIRGTINIFEAARQENVKRVVFASSNHAIGFYERSKRIDHNSPVLPDSRYGVSKAAGEAIASLYAYKYGIGVLNLRIGNFNAEPKENRHLSIWVSPRDLAQLIRIGLDYPGLKYETVFGVSDNKLSWWDNSNAVRLGYAPQDASEAYAAQIAAAEKGLPPRNEIAERYQGGAYCAMP